MTARTGAAAALGLLGLLLGLGLLLRDVGPLAGPDRSVVLTDAIPTTLDTIAVRGRRIEASVNGLVAEVGPGRWAVLSVAGRALPVRFDAPPELAVEDRVLAVGRLRAPRGGRYLEVRSWSVVTATVRPPAKGGL